MVAIGGVEVVYHLVAMKQRVARPSDLEEVARLEAILSRRLSRQAAASQPP